MSATVPAVLDRAADLLDQHGWVPVRHHRSDVQTITALQAIVRSVDEHAGTGPDTADLLETCLDTVTAQVHGVRCGSHPGWSVNGWENRQARAATRNRYGPVPAVEPASHDEIVTTLRHLAQTAAAQPFPLEQSVREDEDGAQALSA